MAERPLAVGGLAEDAGLDEFLQPRRLDVAGNAEIFLEVVEPAHAIEGVAHDQQRVHGSPTTSSAEAIEQFICS